MAAPELGLTRIDLGRGDDEYKRRARTGETEVAAGVVTSSAVLSAAHRARRAAAAAAKALRSRPSLDERCTRSAVAARADSRYP